MRTLKCHKSEVEIECLGDMEEVEELIDPGKDPSPPPHAGGKQKQKRIRKKPDQLRELAESGDRNYAICFTCDTPYSVKNKHNCHVNVKKRKANADADADGGGGAVTKVVRTIACMKRFLPTTIKSAYRPLVLAWMRQLVLAQHRIKLLAVHLLHAFVVDALQSVTLDTLQMMTESTASPVMFLDQTVIRTALSLCSEPNNRQRDTPTFAHLRSAGVFHWHSDHSRQSCVSASYCRHQPSSVRHRNTYGLVRDNAKARVEQDESMDLYGDGARQHQASAHT
jgi:hypothetical protein